MRNRRKIVSQTEYEVIQKKFFGENEPELSTHLGDALNWYSSVCDDKDARRWLNDYLTEQENRKEAIQKLKNVPDEWIPRTAAWLARLALRGYKLGDDNLNFIEMKLANALCHQMANTEVVQVKVKPNIQEYIREKASDLIGEIEGMIDDKVINPGFDFYAFLRSREVSSPVTIRLIDHFTPVAEELVEALDTKDKDLLEGYKKYSAQEMENLAIVYQTIVDDLFRYAENLKKTRKPRAKKKPSVEKLLKNFPYCKGDEGLQIVSVDPRKVVGAAELWTFNPKKSLLSVYRANDSDGLGIRRSVITNINEQTSVSKKVGRKTKERVKAVLDSGKVALRKLMDEINGKGNSVSRITKDTILLRVL